MRFANATSLSSERLQAAFERFSAPYRHDGLTIRVRYSRGADFSGTCFYRDGRIFINLGRRLRFPYSFGTHLSRACSTRNGWSRELFRMQISDAYQLALFIYLHELFHYLVHAAGRSPRRKEAMCDRFAARVLVDHCGCTVLDASGRPAPRERWDFQDLDRFVAAALGRKSRSVARRPIPVRILGTSGPCGDRDTDALRPASTHFKNDNRTKMLQS